MSHCIAISYVTKATKQIPKIMNNSQYVNPLFDDIERIMYTIAGAFSLGSLLREIRMGFISGRYRFHFEYPKAIKQSALSHNLLQDILIICQYS